MTKWTYEIVSGRRIILNGEPVHKVICAGVYQWHDDALLQTISATPLPDGTTEVVYRDTDPVIRDNALELMRLGGWES